MKNTEQIKPLVIYWRLLGAAVRDKRYTQADIAVLWFILNSINSETGSTYPSMATIARCTGLSRRTVARSIERLAELSYVLVTPGSRVQSNAYRAVVGSVTDVTTRSVTNDTTLAAPLTLRGSVTDVTPISSRDNQPKKNQPKETGARKTSSKSKGTTFADWCETFQPGTQLIPDDHAVFAYASRINLPIEYLWLGWIEFEKRHKQSDKLQRSWPDTFYVYVQRGYLGVWGVGKDGFYLTTAGKQLEAEFNSSESGASASLKGSPPRKDRMLGESEDDYRARRLRETLPLRPTSMAGKAILALERMKRAREDEMPDFMRSAI